MTESRIAIVAAAVLLLLTFAACEGQTVPAAGREESNSVAEETIEATSIAVEEPALSEASTEEVPAEAEEIALLPTPTPVQEDTTPEPVVESVDWAATASIDGDYFIRGNPDAPIRLIDYSDFL